MIAAIVAAGLGSRLGSLKGDKPKGFFGDIRSIDRRGVD